MSGNRDSSSGDRRDRSDLTPIDPPPHNCYRARCFCLWWLVPEGTDTKNCRACGSPIRRANPEDWEAVGFREVVREEENAQGLDESDRVNKTKPKTGGETLW